MLFQLFWKLLVINFAFPIKKVSRHRSILQFIIPHQVEVSSKNNNTISIQLENIFVRTINFAFNFHHNYLSIYHYFRRRKYHSQGCMQKFGTFSNEGLHIYPIQSDRFYNNTILRNIKSEVREISRGCSDFSNSQFIRRAQIKVIPQLA